MKQTAHAYDHLKDVYRRMDAVLGDILKRYGHDTPVMVLSDHGFANWGRQFNVNSWLRDEGYLQPHAVTSLLTDADWAGTTAYSMGINGVYLNMAGREKYGTVTAAQRSALLDEIAGKLTALRDTDGRQVVLHAHRSDEVYHGPHTAMAPDLIIGYDRDYRGSWDTCLGGVSPDVLSDNTSAWAADHCCDASRVPGVFFCNRPIAADTVSLVDMGPTILNYFGQPTPAAMTGRNVL